MRKRDEGNVKKELVYAFSMILQLGLAIMVCMGVSFAIGYYLDQLLGTHFFVLIMLVIGILASLRSILVLTGVYKPGKSEEETYDGDGEA